jgi:16S rRNA (guanine527-N7)-methyltransferase
MNINDFKLALAKLNININDNQLQMLSNYASFLMAYNEHTNLTAITNIDDIYLKHFYDSLTIVKVIDLAKVNNLLDIGTGAGFPGLVLKILYPNLNVTLLDSNHKKTDFLKALCQKLNLEVEIVNVRAEDFIKTKREYYDLVASRAVARLNILTEIALPFVKLNGYFIAMKGKDQGEVAEAKTAILKCGGNLMQELAFNLPIDDAERNLIKIEKIQVTALSYPRPYDKIIKKPL